MLMQQIVNGITIGGVYALVALGYSMVYSILRIVNFAHGDIFMIGAFIGLSLSGSLGLPIYVSIALSMLFTAAVGILIERTAYRPLYAKDSLSVLISALGVDIFLQNFARILWGSETHAYPSDWKVKSYLAGNITVTNIQILIMGLTVILLILLYFLVYRSKTGIAMRACSHSIVNARLMGINTNKIIILTFGIGSALAAVAGNLVGIYYDAVYPSMGYSMGMKAFAAAILGGIGSIPGAVVGGFLIGIVEILGSAYLSSGYRDAFAFVVMILILIVRPSGLMGKKQQEKV